MSWLLIVMKQFLLKNNWWFYFVLTFAFSWIITKGSLRYEKEKLDL